MVGISNYDNEVAEKEELKLCLHYVYLDILEQTMKATSKYPVLQNKHSRDNFIGYLLLRNKKINQYDHPLLHLGLSQLSTCEGHVLYSLEKILNHLGMNEFSKSVILKPSPDFAQEEIKSRAYALFGKNSAGRNSSIMVTLDKEMLRMEGLFERLILNGMDIARINCAHDDQQTWEALVHALRKAEGKIGINQPCKIYMDLAGPKIRVNKIHQAHQPESSEPVKLTVKKGDLLRIFLSSNFYDVPGNRAAFASITTTFPKAFYNVKSGDRIFINDGNVQGRVLTLVDGYIDLEITSVNKKAKIKEGHGINLPDSLVGAGIPAITSQDMLNLPFILEHANMVGVSFIHNPSDLQKLQHALKSLPNNHVGVIAKIETKDAIHQLGRIILEGLNFEQFGIMIARGDLAVEIGFENLAVVQEEILRMCYAAHLPVIWATQVLEQLTKEGIPTRAEISDVILGKRAHCIMLNKGPFIAESVKVLASLLKNDTIPQNRLALIEKFTSQYGLE